MLKIFAEFKYSLPSLNLHIAYLLQTDKGTHHATKTTKVKIVDAKPIFSVVHAGNRGDGLHGKRLSILRLRLTG